MDIDLFKILGEKTSTTILKNEGMVSLVLGDYNNDGYTDILLVIKTSTFTSSYTTIKLLESIPCNSNCFPAAQEIKRRYFKVVDKGLDQVAKIGNPVKAAFLDYNNNVIVVNVRATMTCL